MLLRVTDSWSKAIDNRKLICAVFLDLAKAFDCVNYEILLDKLPFYGIRDTPLLWISNYLLDRTQRVMVNNDFSDWGNISIGVPQGSILGPLLFSLYINDLPVAISNSQVSLYADDTELHMCCDNIIELQSKVQSDLDALSQWLSSNHLRINSGKTVMMLWVPPVDLKVKLSVYV